MTLTTFPLDETVRLAQEASARRHSGLMHHPTDTIYREAPYRSVPPDPYPRSRMSEVIGVRGPLARCPACLFSFVRTCRRNPGEHTLFRGSLDYKNDPTIKCAACDGETEAPTPTRVVTCTPLRRVRSGFLWLRRCPEPGTHVHQDCGNCRWMALLLPATDLEEREAHRG